MNRSFCHLRRSRVIKRSVFGDFIDRVWKLCRSSDSSRRSCSTFHFLALGLEDDEDDFGVVIKTEEDE